MEKHLSLYRELKITKTELQQAIGEDLHNVECQKAYRIKRSDVVNAIQLLQNGTISKDTLVEWVNVVWFTELFVFDDEDADSIVSVLEVLETMDEDGVVVSEDEFSEMMGSCQYFCANSFSCLIALVHPYRSGLWLSRAAQPCIYP